MAVRPIVVYPDPRLKAVCAPLPVGAAEARRVATDLRDTLETVPGTGIAAPQIGELVRLVYLDAGRNPKHADGAHPALWLVNPVIVERVGTQRFREGCLSLPQLTGQVKRAKRVEVAALDLDGEPQRIIFEGFAAVLAQHEIDHLDGVLFLDRMESRASLMRREERREEG
jgi:peptide deformylase